MRVILILGFSSAVGASSKFTPNCTAPTEQVNLVWAPTIRSTLSILWSCLFTIFTCTWTVLHLHVPEQREGRDPGKWGDLKWKLKGFLRTLKWMAIMLVAPELVTSIAAAELANATSLSKMMTEQVRDDEVTWTLTHSFFANMGGFAIRTTKNGVSSSLATDQVEAKSLPADIISTSGNLKKVDKGAGRIVFLSGPALLYLRTQKYLSRLPDISVDDIDDKNKSDVLVKTLAIVQIASIVIQVIARHVRGLAMSQLELSVTAFSFCATVIFSLLFYMPKDVRTPTVIDLLDDSLTFDQACQLLRPYRAVDPLKMTQRTGYDVGLRNFLDPDTIGGDQSGIVTLSVMTLTGILFGAIHCLAWSFRFPTKIEQLLWQSASIATTVLPISFITLFLLFYTVHDRALFHNSAYVFKCAIYICFLLYTIARLYIMAETVRTLFFLPPSAFISTWASNIPEFG